MDGNIGLLSVLIKRTLSHQWSFEEHLPLVHNYLVRAGLRSSKEGDVFILEGLQGFGFTSLIHRHIVSTHTQPQIVRETTLFALQRKDKIRKRCRCQILSIKIYCTVYLLFLFSHLHIKQSRSISRPLLDNTHIFQHGLMLGHSLQPGPLLQHTGSCGRRLLLHPHLQHLLLLHLQQHMSAKRDRNHFSWEVNVACCEARERFC